MTQPTAWDQQRERGSLLGMRLTAWLYRRFGSWLARLCLYPIVVYFYLTDRRARSASRSYLQRLYETPEGAAALGEAPRLRHVWHHFLEFGSSILDRVGFWLGRREDFELEISGMGLLDKLAAEGRGGLILGAHLGSFDAMRLVASMKSPISVWVLMYIRNAARINHLFERLEGSKDLKVRVIPVEPGSLSHVLAVKRCIERGEVVAMLADRLHPQERRRTVEVDFLGAKARLPQGPMLLASALGCPVLLMFGLRRAGRRYEIHVEPFADPVEIPRRERPVGLQRYCQAYAQRVAHYCAAAPYQWFNFYDFWQPESADVER